jgi:predicted nucleotidyltransferase
MISLRSGVTRKVLGYFFLNESESLYVNEMARLLDLDRGNLVRKLRELEERSILLSEFHGNQRYYFLNKKHPLYKEYRTIILKTVGFEAQAREMLREMPGIENAFIFGSYAREGMDSASDVDLLVVGSHDTVNLQRKVRLLQKAFGREINVISISPAEFCDRRRKDPFFKRVLGAPRIELV